MSHGGPWAHASVTDIYPAPAGLPTATPREACGALARTRHGVWLRCQRAAGHDGAHTDDAAAWHRLAWVPVAIWAVWGYIGGYILIAGLYPSYNPTRAGLGAVGLAVAVAAVRAVWLLRRV